MSRGLQVIVTGGRHYMDGERLAGVLRWLRPSLIIHGGATGADALAGAWAEANGVRCEVHEADWKRLGRKAGPLRNGQMLTEHPHALVVAFPGGRGTADMVRQTRNADRSVLLIDGGPD